MDLLIALGIAALLSRVGFALYSTGLVRAKNSAGIVLRNICDLCVAFLAFWAIGFAILDQSKNKWFWADPAFTFGAGAHDALRSGSAIFIYAVMVLMVTPVVGGAVAERCRLLPLAICSLVLGGLALPITCKWAWTGWLRVHHGFIDVAGGACLHLSAGIFALVAVVCVGPRAGKFNRDGSSSMIPGHNIPIAAIGALVILLGSIPYIAMASIIKHGGGDDNLAAIAGAAAINVLVAASAAGVASMLFAQFRYGKPDILLALIGILGGVVSICGGGAALSPRSAFIVGAVAGIIVPIAAVAIDLRLRLDDPLGIISIYAVGGVWGTLAPGFFVNPTPPLTRGQQIAAQLLGIALIIAASAVIALAVFGIARLAKILRAPEADEFDGLDLAEHDIGAYPDFQQNSIKSYHLREA